MNFWIDVTNTCKSAINTGVPRTVRGIYRLLQKQGKVTPVRWDRPLRQYCLLTATEKRALEGDLQANPSKHWRFITRHLNKIDLLSQMSPEDYFIQVEIFQDERNEWIEQNFSRLKSIAVFHDAIAWTHPELTAPQRRARFDDYMTSLHRFTQVITISEESKQALQNHWNQLPLNSSKKISVLPWPSEFSSVDSKPAPVTLLPEILTISTLEQRKNHLLLFKACEYLWKKGLCFKLRVVGKKCPYWGKRVIEEISRLQENGYPIHWEKQISDEELQKAYLQCSFTVYPSLIEGFGLPILESLSHLRPVLCSNQGAIAETAKLGGCLTIDVTSVEKLSEGLSSLLTDQELYDRLLKEILQIRFLSWNDYHQKFQEILHS